MSDEAQADPQLGQAARLGVRAASWLLAALTWLPCLQLFFRPGDDAGPAATGPAPPEVGPLLLGAEARWQDSGVQALLRGRNPEWDFMARTCLTLARANLALREPERQAGHLARADALSADTLALEQEHGPLYFLLGYAQGRRWKLSPPRSGFVDGEIALMLAARCLVEDRADYRAELAARVAELERRLRQSPVLSGESYPDECGHGGDLRFQPPGAAEPLPGRALSRGLVRPGRRGPDRPLARLDRLAPRALGARTPGDDRASAPTTSPPEVPRRSRSGS